MHRGIQTDLWRWTPAQPQQDLQAPHDLVVRCAAPAELLAERPTADVCSKA